MPPEHDTPAPEKPSQISADEGETPQETPPQAPWRRLWQGQRENLRVLAIALILAVVMRIFVAEPRYIPSDSMKPTLYVGDRLIVEKVSYRLHPPQAGDIVVFRPPFRLNLARDSRRQAFIKRVIATPGQTVAVTAHTVFVNNIPLAEPYILEAPSYEMLPVQVPMGGVFVMGDNRNDSNDSHVWGVLPESNIIGVARLRFWPLDRWGWLS
jgi:signal peptidase I